MGYPKPWKIHIDAPCVDESVDIRGIVYDPFLVTQRLDRFAYQYVDSVSVVIKACYRKKELWVEIDIIRKEEL